MSDFFDEEGTTTIGEHEMYPVAVTREYRQENPDAAHDELVAGKCDDCGMRSQGHRRAFDAAVKEIPCPAPSPDEMASESPETMRGPPATCPECGGETDTVKPGVGYVCSCGETFGVQEVDADE